MFQEESRLIRKNKSKLIKTTLETKSFGAVFFFVCDHPAEWLQNCSHKVTAVWLCDVLILNIYPLAGHEAHFTDNTSCEKVIQFSVSSDFGAAPDLTALINDLKLLLKMTTGEKGKGCVPPQ